MLAAEQAVEWTQAAPPQPSRVSELIPRLHFEAVSRFTAGLIRTHATRDGLVCRAVGLVPVLMFAERPVECEAERVVYTWRIIGGAFAREQDLGRMSSLTLGVTWTASGTPRGRGVRCRAWTAVEAFPSRFLAPTERPVLASRAVGSVYRTFHAHVVFSYLTRLATELAAERG
jgi:hypothetical protein